MTVNKTIALALAALTADPALQAAYTDAITAVDAGGIKYEVDLIGSRLAATSVARDRARTRYHQGESEETKALYDAALSEYEQSSDRYFRALIGTAGIPVPGMDVLALHRKIIAHLQERATDIERVAAELAQRHAREQAEAEVFEREMAEYLADKALGETTAAAPKPPRVGASSAVVSAVEDRETAVREALNIALIQDARMVADIVRADAAEALGRYVVAAQSLAQAAVEADAVVRLSNSTASAGGWAHRTEEHCPFLEKMWKAAFGTLVAPRGLEDRVAESARDLTTHYQATGVFPQ